ncbi:MAG: hypothetical protein B6I35_12850 [Anaerolineaceae bacterium 4572_32.2]|nr:MAG: hypothetical protein B6I35_12850 [Anaerolineaceae bacterium 4572_32.2]RLC71693.1 MAG: hypothetical protein DRI81_17380 [Chloroflexota bacterium]
MALDGWGIAVQTVACHDDLSQSLRQVSYHIVKHLSHCRRFLQCGRAWCFGEYQSTISHRPRM